MRITVLGCGTSGGVPRIGPNWGECDPSEPKNRRRRCAVLVERFGDAGTTQVLVDTGPDLREQLLTMRIQHLDGVLLTHDHADHTHGIDDVRAITVRSASTMRGRELNTLPRVRTSTRLHAMP